MRNQALQKYREHLLIHCVTLMLCRSLCRSLYAVQQQQGDTCLALDLGILLSHLYAG